MASEAAAYREDIEQWRRRFAEFRQTHAARSRLPRELWAAAARLARRDGIAATARALGVDRPSLQKWTDRLEPRTSGKARLSRRRPSERGGGAPAFVELLTAAPGASPQCRMEVESRQGGKLRLELHGLATGQLVELIRAFAAD